MKYVFLTAFRNESSILRAFLDEFTAMVQKAGVADDAVLYMVDEALKGLGYLSSDGP